MNSTGFIEFTKVVARDAVIEYFDPLASLMRLFERRLIGFRIGALKFRTDYDSQGFQFAILNLFKETKEVAVAGFDLELEIRTVRDTVRFLEVRRKSRLDLAIAAERVNNVTLQHGLMKELLVIESELSNLDRRLSSMLFRQSVQCGGQTVNSFEDEKETDVLRQVMQRFLDSRDDEASPPELRALVERSLQRWSYWRS